MSSTVTIPLCWAGSSSWHEPTATPDERRSTKIFGYLGVPEEERVSEEAMNQFAEGVSRILISGG
jgi:hypothetical protein